MLPVVEALCAIDFWKKPNLAKGGFLTRAKKQKKNWKMPEISWRRMRFLRWTRNKRREGEGVEDGGTTPQLYLDTISTPSFVAGPVRKNNQDSKKEREVRRRHLYLEKFATHLLAGFRFSKFGSPRQSLILLGQLWRLWPQLRDVGSQIPIRFLRLSRA